jgi:hypothetical protein
MQRESRTTVNSVDHPVPIRHTLSTNDLRRIHTAIRDATSTRQLLAATLDALYTALSGATTPAGTRLAGTTPSGPISADQNAIPASQWQAILNAVTRRAEAWGTAAEIGLELALNLMPGRYDDPTVPAPDLRLGDYRPAEYRLTLTCGAVDVIAACEAHLARLRACYGPASQIYQTALHSWHSRLSDLLTMNNGADTQIGRDGELALLVRAGSGLVYALIFHGDTRHCTAEGCDALLDDDGTPRPAHTGAVVLDHPHTPSYPPGAPRPGTWTFHS